MRRFALLVWLGFGFLGAEAQRIDLDFSGAAVGDAKIGDTGTIHFSPLQDTGLPRWYFRIQAIQPGQVLNLVAPSSNELPACAYVSSDAGKTWQRSAHAVIDEKLKQTSYEIAAAASSCLFSSHLPFSHATAAQWMESLSRADGIEVLPFGPPEAGLSVLRFCEGDRVEARRPLIWIQSGNRANDGAGCWTSMTFGRWLAGSSVEAVWLRQNTEVLILPLMCSPPKPFVLKQVREGIDKILRQITNEERPVTKIELYQGSMKATDLVLREAGPNPPTDASFFGKLQDSVETLTVWTARRGYFKEISAVPLIRIEIPWNTSEAIPSNYEKLGVAFGEALAATLRSTN